MKKNKTMIVCFTLPAAIVFLVMFLYPVIRTTMMSFFTMESVSSSIKDWTFVGVQNYSEFPHPALMCLRALPSWETGR